jgi:hypothetical protein
MILSCEKKGSHSEFPERLYTLEELLKVREMLLAGYMHCLKVEGDLEFKKIAEKAIDLVKTAEYFDFLRIHIRTIKSIDGLSQLREAEATIWANKHTFANALQGAGFLIQKAQQMKDYLEGNPYYGGLAEAKAVNKRIEFLEKLHEKSKDPNIKKKVQKELKAWTDAHIGTL